LFTNEEGGKLEMYIIHTEKASVNIVDIQKISQLTSLKVNDYRVLFLLMGHIDGRTYKKINPSKLAEELGITKKQVKKSLENLEEVELIEEGSNEHVKAGYKFNF
jgi:DNA-binding MarR family transcriptional regulator